MLLLKWARRLHVYTLGRWIPQGGPLKQEQMNRGGHKGVRDLAGGWEPQIPEQKSFSLRAEAQMGRKETQGSYVILSPPAKRLALDKVRLDGGSPLYVTYFLSCRCPRASPCNLALLIRGPVWPYKKAGEEG